MPMSLSRRENKRELHKVTHKLNHDDIFIAITRDVKELGKE